MEQCLALLPLSCAGDRNYDRTANRAVKLSSREATVRPIQRSRESDVDEILTTLTNAQMKEVASCVQALAAARSE